MQLAKIFYPGWKARFYHSSEVPAPVLAELRRLGAELRLLKSHAHRDGVTHADSGIDAIWWRYLVANDTSVDRYIVVSAQKKKTQTEGTPRLLVLPPPSIRTTGFTDRPPPSVTPRRPSLPSPRQRDTDSRLNARERFAVEDWINDGAPLHVMRGTCHCSKQILVVAYFGTGK